MKYVCKNNKSYLKPSFFFYNEKKNKENFEFVSHKQIDDDDDAESSHSDCLIIEPDVPTSKSDEVSNSKQN